MSRHERSATERGHQRVDALDGIRAIAVAAVVAYHLDAPWARGGFLGVSLFFTLSGYLITTLLLREHARTGRIDLRAFYQRRLRRLAPASITVVVVCCAELVARHDWTAGARGDALAVLTYIANWRQVWQGASYGAMFGPTSPFLHFWSLAVEEQFYLCFPIVAVACLRRSRRTLAGVLTVAFGASLIAGFVSSGDARYFRTDVRASELLAGCLLAVAIRRPARLARVRRLPAATGPLALVAFAVMAAAVPVSNPSLYTAILPLTTIASCVLIVHAASAESRLSAWLSIRPLAVVGRLSYVIYLVHWPVIAFVDGLAPRLVAMAVSTVLLHLAIERPALHATPRRAFVPAMSFSVLSIVGIALGPAAPAQASGFGSSSSQAPARVVSVRRASTPSGELVVAHPATTTTAPTSDVLRTSVETTPPTPPRPLRVLVLGDSTGDFLAGALTAVPGLDVTSAARRGCPLLDDDELRVQLTVGGPFKHWDDFTGNDYGCDWRTYLPALPGDFDIALVVAGPTMTPNYREADSRVTLRVDEPAGASWLAGKLASFGDELARHARASVWLTAPPSETIHGGNHDDWYWTSPARTSAWNAVERGEAARSGATVVDFASWFFAQLDHDSYRPDGSHLEGPGAAIAAGYVADELAAIASPQR